MKQQHSGPVPVTAADQQNNKKSAAPRRFTRILTALVTVAMVLAALLSFLYRDRLSSEALQELWDPAAPLNSGNAAFSYENGADQTFALAGDGFALASVSGVQLLDSKGNTVVKEICSLETPAVTACSSAALYFDIGGSTCKPRSTCRSLQAINALSNQRCNYSGQHITTTTGSHPGIAGLNGYTLLSI